MSMYMTLKKAQTLTMYQTKFQPVYQTGTTSHQKAIQALYVRMLLISDFNAIEIATK